ncbi:MAG: hypothetical protein P8Y38_03865 [Deltaproteobacteria bacterium]|jgi:hypothetical protein
MQTDEKKKKKSKILGIILPFQWDENGKVTRISINTHDEKEYEVDYSGHGKELLNHLQKMVEIDGKLVQRLGGAQYVKVHHFNLIEDKKETLWPWLAKDKRYHLT